MVTHGADGKPKAQDREENRAVSASVLFGPQEGITAGSCRCKANCEHVDYSHLQKLLGTAGRATSNRVSHRES